MVMKSFLLVILYFEGVREGEVGGCCPRWMEGGIEMGDVGQERG